MRHELLGHQRTMIQLAIGDVPHRELMRSIELLGTEVAPAVRAEVARREASVTTPLDEGLIPVGRAS